MARKLEEGKVRIILDNFIKNEGHYRKMSEELTQKYGPGYSVGMISNIINSVYIDEMANEKEKQLIKKYLTMNSNNLTDETQADNFYYNLSSELQIKIVIELYLSGRTMQQIATALGISKAKVSRIIKSAAEDTALSSLYAKKIEQIKTEHKQRNEGLFRK